MNLEDHAYQRFLEFLRHQNLADLHSSDRLTMG